jgi:N-methylhydantoinase A
MRRGSGLPLDIPAIDLVEIGTGGGSIAEARVGVVSVGPRSAGADPGPACYGHGGREPTVTDANLLLGYLNPDEFAGGAMTLDPEASERAVGGLGRALGLDLERAAWGVHEVATLEMERAARLVSIDRGVDPRELAMVCFGGAAPAHGARLARALGVGRVIVPPAAGVGSALGLLEGDESFELARTAIVRLGDPAAAEEAAEIFRGLEAEARAVVGATWGDRELAARRTVGLRLAGQGHELEVAIDESPDDLGRLVEAFHEQYQRVYGYRENLPLEAVTWFLTLLHERGEAAADGDAPQPTAGPPQKGARAAHFPGTGRVETPVLARERLAPGDAFDGPCLVEEAHTTTVVPPGDTLQVDERGALLIEVGR